MDAGYRTNINALTTLGKGLDGFSGQLDTTMRGYPVAGIPDFGQYSSVSFAPAQDLAAGFAACAAEHAAARADLVRWVHTMGTAAGDIGQRYATNEDAASASAKDIQHALDTANTVP